MEKSNQLNKIILISLIIIIFIISIFVINFFRDNKLDFVKSADKIYADGVSTIFYKLVYKNRIKQLLYPFKDNFSISVNDSSLVKIIKIIDGFYIKSKLKAGSLFIEISADQNKLSDSLIISNNYNDADMDGFPDVAELNNEQDKSSFINWFVSIAESQFYTESYSWYDIHKDCAGLVVFSFKEALKKHDNLWRKKFVYLIDESEPDVGKYNYPELPLLNDKVFRTKNGSFNKSDLDNNVFSATSDVNNLLNFNLLFISKDIADIKKGDIIFFNVPNNMPYPYHSMIYTGKNDFLIYHTGQIDNNNNGEVRKVKIKDLMKHPDKNWHPAKDNPCFLGIYRWKIIT